jgi:hypothetical protein
MTRIPSILLLFVLATGCAAAPRAREVVVAAHAGVDAQVEQVTPTAQAATAVVSFHNQTERDLRIVRFRVTWPGGSVVVAPHMLDVLAGTSRETELQIGPEAGDLYALYEAPLGARVEVLEVR